MDEKRTYEAKKACRHRKFAINAETDLLHSMEKCDKRGMELRKESPEGKPKGKGENVALLPQFLPVYPFPLGCPFGYG